MSISDLRTSVARLLVAEFVSLSFKGGAAAHSWKLINAMLDSYEDGEITWQDLPVVDCLLKLEMLPNELSIHTGEGYDPDDPEDQEMILLPEGQTAEKYLEEQRLIGGSMLWILLQDFNHSFCSILESRLQLAVDSEKYFDDEFEIDSSKVSVYDMKAMAVASRDFTIFARLLDRVFRTYVIGPKSKCMNTERRKDYETLNNSFTTLICSLQVFIFGEAKG